MGVAERRPSKSGLPAEARRRRREPGKSSERRGPETVAAKTLATPLAPQPGWTGRGFSRSSSLALSRAPRLSIKGGCRRHCPHWLRAQRLPALDRLIHQLLQRNLVGTTSNWEKKERCWAGGGGWGSWSCCLEFGTCTARAPQAAERLEPAAFASPSLDCPAQLSSAHLPTRSRSSGYLFAFLLACPLCTVFPPTPTHPHPQLQYAEQHSPSAL